MFKSGPPAFSPVREEKTKQTTNESTDAKVGWVEKVKSQLARLTDTV